MPEFLGFWKNDFTTPHYPDVINNTFTENKGEKFFFNMTHFCKGVHSLHNQYGNCSKVFTGTSPGNRNRTHSLQNWLRDAFYFVEDYSAYSIGNVTWHYPGQPFAGRQTFPLIVFSHSVPLIKLRNYYNDIVRLNFLILFLMQ